MLELGSFDDARRKVLADARKSLTGLNRLMAEPAESIDDTVELLTSIRRQVQEHLNHIQHQQMIVCAAEWLVRHSVAGVPLRWLWNPRQSGERGAPDLVGLEGETVRVCADVSAVDEPIGVVDTQMRRGLTRLAAMEGRRFYFVRSVSMKRRAVTKVVKGGWDIAVVQIALQPEPQLLPRVSACSLAGASLAGNR